MATPGSPLLGNDWSDFATDAENKIGPAIAKEGRASSSALECLSSKEEMEKDTFRHQINGAESVRIWKARSFIDAHFSEELSLGKVAKAANTSANYLSEKFKEATGTNFVKYVARTRFEKAAGCYAKPICA